MSECGECHGCRSWGRCTSQQPEVPVESDEKQRAANVKLFSDLVAERAEEKGRERGSPLSGAEVVQLAADLADEFSRKLHERKPIES